MADANTRPNFFVPFPEGSTVSLKSYAGHNPADKKMDIYASGWPSVVASAPGLVHESFYPGGIEIRHFIPGTRTLGNWYTTYMHMADRARVGSYVEQGQWVGEVGSVGTSAKHLHFEQLHDPSGRGDAFTNDMVLPAFVEYRNGAPFSMPVGEPGIRLISKNKKGITAPSTKPPKPLPTPSKKVHQGAPIPAMIRRGSGQYFGLITGPANSHGGYYPNERLYVGMIQQRLIACGFVPGITDINSNWVDRKFEQPTADAVTRFQKKHMPHTQFFGQVWWDDWMKLFNL